MTDDPKARDSGEPPPAQPPVINYRRVDPKRPRPPASPPSRGRFVRAFALLLILAAIAYLAYWGTGHPMRPLIYYWRLVTDGINRLHGPS